jgi:hypothetical protein
MQTVYKVYIMLSQYVAIVMCLTAVAMLHSTVSNLRALQALLQSIAVLCYVNNMREMERTLLEHYYYC